MTTTIAIHSGRSARADREKLVQLLSEHRTFRNSNGSLVGKPHVAGQSLPDNATGELPDDIRPLTTDADYIVYSYETPIAWHVQTLQNRDETGHPHGKWMLPDVRYSATTSRHQQAIALALDGYPFRSTDVHPQLVCVFQSVTAPAIGDRAYRS